MNLDLAVLVPCKPIEQALDALLTDRVAALRIRAITYKMVVHPGRDPGCYNTPESLLGPFARDTSHALVVFDRVWEGAPSTVPAELAAAVEKRLRPMWADRAKCIVIDPEIEQWVWSTSPRVDEALGWKGKTPKLRDWLESEALWPKTSVKPPDPKEAFHRAVRNVRLPPSSAIFRKLAETVSVEKCSDPSFHALVEILRIWFPKR